MRHGRGQGGLEWCESTNTKTPLCGGAASLRFRQPPRDGMRKPDSAEAEPGNRVRMSDTGACSSS